MENADHVNPIFSTIKLDKCYVSKHIGNWSCHYTTFKAYAKFVPVFIHIPKGHHLGCYMANMDVIPLLG